MPRKYSVTASTAAAYKLELTSGAEKDLSLLPKTILKIVDGRILALAEDPRPSGVKKFKGPRPFYRIRAGSYRVVYLVDDSSRTVTVARVRHRKEVYRGL